MRVSLDHLGLNVGDLNAVHRWYTSVLGLTVEFEVADPPTVGLKDSSDFTLILRQQAGPPTRCNLFFQVDDVAGAHRELSERGVLFEHDPQVNDWGYGAELVDPDGRLVGLWDQESMAANEP